MPPVETPPVETDSPPDHADPFAEGLRCAHSAAFVEAIDWFQRAVARRPNADASANIGYCLKQLGRGDEALLAYAEALALDPRHAGALVNLGCLLVDRGELAEAEQTLLEACRLAPRDAGALVNLCTAYYAQGRMVEAEVMMRITLEIHPELSAAHRNLANVLLLKGELAEGFREYEWRLGSPDISPSIDGARFHKPVWQGESLAGKTLLAITEQGTGDTLHLLRYGALVQAQGGRMILTCQPPLARLLADQPVLDGLLRSGDSRPEIDFHAPLMSLPHLFGTTLETVPAAMPYLRVREEWLAEWAPRLGPRTKPRIGFIWAGSPTHKNDRNRSLPIHRLAPFIEDGRFDCISLQVGGRDEDDAFLAAHPALRRLAAPFRDYADTAAVVQQLDLLITVDTSVAHLAGALGKPVWVMLPMVPDWRWLMGRGDSPWYPSMRLFRQSRIGDWDGVLAEVQAALHRTGLF